MQKASVMKGSGLKPLEGEAPNEEVHVFGKNLEERVVKEDEEESPSISSFNIVSQSKPEEEDDIESIRKRKFDAITGEEDEETIFQGEFKLYDWDWETSNWREKGRGQLKLNDSIGEEEKKSRLIMRVSGTLRIILNVAINRSYFNVIGSSRTSIRFSDSQTVWAVSGSPTVHQLKDLIDERLKIDPKGQEEGGVKKRSISDEGDKTPAKKTKAESELVKQDAGKVTTDESESAHEELKDKDLDNKEDSDIKDHRTQEESHGTSSSCSSPKALDNEDSSGEVNNESEEKVNTEIEKTKGGTDDENSVDKEDRSTDEKED